MSAIPPSPQLQVSHFPMLMLYLKPADQKLALCTQLGSEVTMEGVAYNREELERRGETVFDCEELFQAQSWNHVVVAIQKPGVKGRTKVTLFVNGQLVKSQKVSISWPRNTCRSTVLCVGAWLWLCRGVAVQGRGCEGAWGRGYVGAWLCRGAGAWLCESATASFLRSIYSICWLSHGRGREWRGREGRRGRWRDREEGGGREERKEVEREGGEEGEREG